MFYDFVDIDREAARVSFDNRLGRLLEDGCSSTSAFCLGSKSSVVDRNIRTFFSVAYSKLNSTEFGFTRTAETEILKFYKQRLADRITLNNASDEAQSKLDVITIAVIAGKFVVPSVVISHYHNDKMLVIKAGGSRESVLPVGMLIAPLTNSEEAFQYWMNHARSAPSVHRGMTIQDIKATQALFTAGVVKVTALDKPIKQIEVKENVASPVVTVKKSRVVVEDDFTIPSNVSHEVDLSKYLKQKPMRAYD